MLEFGEGDCNWEMRMPCHGNRPGGGECRRRSRHHDGLIEVSHRGTEGRRTGLCSVFHKSYG